MTILADRMQAEPRNSTRIQLVGACFYMPPATFSRRLSDLNAKFALEAGAVQSTCVAIDNPERRIGEVPTEWLTSQGEFLDMSAYGTAVAGPADDRITVFINDTLFLRHPWRLMAARIGKLLPSLADAPYPAAAGEIHPTTDTMYTDQCNPQRRHLSTFCFAVNGKALRIFQEVIRDTPCDGSSTSIRRWIDRQVKDYPALEKLLHIHLFGPDSFWTWQPKTRGKVDQSLLLRKAVTVIMEYRFSADLIRAGGMIMPVNIGLRYRVSKRLARMAGR